MSMRSRLTGAVALAAATAALLGTAVPAAAAERDRTAATSASVWRDIAVTGNFTIRDDEGWSAGTYCSGSLASEGWVNEVRQPSLWWSTTCGGEIRVEKHVSAQTDASGGVQIYVSLLFFEGTNDTNNDLDAEYHFDRYVPAGGATNLSEITLRNRENGGKDWAKLTLSLHNNR
ncbi:hypothetical protein ACWEV4_09680 [Streptomyces sp. NPDC003860]